MQLAHGYLAVLRKVVVGVGGHAGPAAELLPLTISELPLLWHLVWPPRRGVTSSAVPPVRPG